jgi:hypothetical protein
MPEPTPADALDRMRRQVRAVRWRRNLHELQRAVYYLLAMLAGAASVVVVLALRTEPGFFAAAAWGLAAATFVCAAWLARATRRAFLAAHRPPDRADRSRGALGDPQESGARRAGCETPGRCRDVGGNSRGRHPGSAA